MERDPGGGRDRDDYERARGEWRGQPRDWTETARYYAGREDEWGRRYGRGRYPGQHGGGQYRGG